MSIYGGVNGVAKEIKSIYAGVNGVAKEIKAVYAGVNGVARKVWPAAVGELVCIPTMTSNSAPSGTAARSSRYQDSNTYDAWKAFDKDSSSRWSSKIWGSGDHDNWVRYDFGYEIRPIQFYVKNGQMNDTGHLKFVIEATNDVSSWTTLLDCSDRTTETDEFFSLSTANTYRYFRYRCPITSSPGSGRVLVYEFNVWGYKQ